MTILALSLHSQSRQWSLGSPKQRNFQLIFLHQRRKSRDQLAGVLCCKFGDILLTHKIFLDTFSIQSNLFTYVNLPSFSSTTASASRPLFSMKKNAKKKERESRMPDNQKKTITIVLFLSSLLRSVSSPPHPPFLSPFYQPTFNRTPVARNAGNASRIGNRALA